MKKVVSIMLCLFFLTALKAQQDTLKKFRLSAFQVDIGPNFYPDFNQQTQADYQKVIKNDPFLNEDLTGYTKENWFREYTKFNGLLGFKIYADIKDFKKIKKEVVIGLRYGQEGNTGVYYAKRVYDTIGIYTDQATGKKMYELSKFENVYEYGITCQKLILPLGLNFCTNKQRMFWITYGIELAPALNFNYVFRSINRRAYSSILLKEGDTLNSRANHETNFIENTAYKRMKRTNLDGAGFGFYASFPFALYFHPFKKVKFLKHINVLGSVIPVYIYSKSKYSGSASAFYFSVATGIRYNW